MRTPASPPDIDRVLTATDPTTFLRAVELGRLEEGYPHWDKLRRRPAPEGLTAELWWAGVKLSRVMRQLPLRATDGFPFVFSLPPLLDKALHEVSIHTAGDIGVSATVLNDESRNRYLLSSLREEAISSSLLEGAATTRQLANEMLRSSRPPRTKGERMVSNNYAAMQWIKRHKDEAVTPERVQEVHAILTEGTLDDPADEGRIQTPEDVRVYVEGPDRDVVHQPPPAKDLPGRLDALCRFANGGEEGDQWIHPLVRAIITHFMVGYDHYFVDGNGRTARALFYWVALREGHWLIEYLTLSRFLVEAPAQYARAYLYTETDGGDVTYFLIHQLEVLQKCLSALSDYVQARQKEALSARQLTAGLGLNHRQLAVVYKAAEDPGTRVTAQSHAQSHAVTLQTARSDLAGLEELGLLHSERRGRRVEWIPAAKIVDRLGKLNGAEL